MNISKEELEQIIKEEIDTAVEEGILDPAYWSAHAKGAAAGLGKRAKALRTALGGKIAGGEVGAQAKTAAAAMKGQAADASKAKRTEVIVGAHMRRLQKDLQKLGLADQNSVKSALGQLAAAVRQASKGQVSEE